MVEIIEYLHHYILSYE